MLPTVVKAAALAYDAVRRPASGLVVLIYHRVGARTSTRVDLPTAAFDDQMAALADAGAAVSMDDAVARLAAGEDLSGHVVVTFDDGTADFAEEAVPVMVGHGIPSTLYLATAHVEDRVAFPGGGMPTTWGALSDCLETGLVTIGSHTHNHALLDRLPRDAIAAELDRSIGLIEDRLQVSADHFAYPKALPPSGDADREVRARFRSAALAGTRANVVGADVYRLARTPVQTGDSPLWFKHKLAGGMSLEDDVRRLVNRRRYAGATA